MARAPNPNWFEASRAALATTQRELGAQLGISRRTAQRWTRDGTPGHMVAPLARLVHARDPELATRMVAALGMTLGAAGIAVPDPPAPSPPSVRAAAAPPLEGLVDAVVCAAADAMDQTPQEVRPGLLAAFCRAQEIGLTMEAIEGVLRARLRIAEPPPPARATAGEPVRRARPGREAREANPPRKPGRGGGG
jgi:hypothetical protein